jgi:hypothetical protein
MFSFKSAVLGQDSENFIVIQTLPQSAAIGNEEAR